MQIHQELTTNEGVLRGYLHKPKKAKKYPLVIMYHGFTGHKVENRFLFVQYSRFLSTHNIASLRFDFLGSGESDQDFSYMTLSREVSDAKAIFEYAKSLPNISEIIVMGLSMGGVIATQIAKTYYADVAKLILWAPAGMIKEALIAREKDYHPLPNGNYDLGGIELNPLFIEDVKSYDFHNGINIFQNPVAIFHGLEDNIVPLSVSQNYQKRYQNCQLFTYENCGHTFTNVLGRKNLFFDNIKFILNK